MNKKKAIVLAAVIGLVILLGVTFLVELIRTPKVTANVTKNIEVKDGKYEGDSFSIPFSIKKAGNYRCKVGFWPEGDPGFLSGFYINDEDGEGIWGATAQKLTMDGNVRFVEKGDYEIVFEIIANNEVGKDFYDNHRLFDFEYTSWDGFKDSSMEMTYEFAIIRDPKDYFPLIALLCGALGIIIATITSISLINGKKVKFDYDERMLLSRYKSEELALWIIVSGMIIIFLLSVADTEYVIGTGLQVFLVLILGITVAAVDSIMNDGYFAMNYNKKGYIIFEIIMCIICFLTTVAFAFKKMLYVDGKVTVCVVFPIIFVMQTVLFTALIIKHKKDSAED